MEGFFEVGENGCNKTTLAKLLTGLYLPTAGTVTWDGDELVDLCPSTVWGATGMVAQDYVRWPLAARENITLGQPRPEGDEAVHAAAALAGADTVLAQAPRRPRHIPGTLLVGRTRPFRG